MIIFFLVWKERILTENIDILQNSAIDDLFQCVVSDRDVRHSGIFLEMTLRETALDLKGFSDFFFVINQWHTDLSIENHETDPARTLPPPQITHIKQNPFRFVFGIPLTNRTESNTLLLLWLLLRYLTKISRPSDKIPKELTDTTAPSQAAAVYHELNWGLLRKDNRIKLGDLLTQDKRLKALSLESRERITALLIDIYLREHKLLASAILFYQKNVRDIKLGFKEPEMKQPERKPRLDLIRPFQTTLIKNKEQYQAQVIEYSTNGSGLSLLIPTISKKESAQLGANGTTISLQIGPKKYSGDMMHMHRRGEGLFLGIQFRFPIQDLGKILSL